MIDRKLNLIISLNYCQSCRDNSGKTRQYREYPDLDAIITAAVAGSAPGMYPQGNEILVVVHEPKRRERIVRVLADEGFAVTAAAEGLTALRASANRRFGLIVAAVNLPGSLDGPTIVRRARQHQPWLKVLYTDEPASRPALGNPDTDDFIALPFERHELIGCTFELLQRTALSHAEDLGRRIRTELRAS